VTDGRQLPDAVDASLAVRWAPPAALPYVQLARLDRPIGWWLLLLPCWWSSALAAIAEHRPPNLVHLALFLIGAVAMRGAGSTYNDILDRKLDAKVERTAARPLPARRLSVAAATVFLILQALLGLLVLISFNRFTIGLGLASLLIVAVYPFMKRLISWPQAVLGLAFAWGSLMGWAAVFASLSSSPLLLYVGAVFWTIGYDTIYALQDARDDAIVGIGSTARLFEEHVSAAVSCLYGAASVALAMAFVLLPFGSFTWLGWAGFSGHLLWQVRHIRRGDTQRALQLFRSNRDAGLILFAGLAMQAAVGAAAYS
jgi:4-hydroxybenzoate polyprenyltransferase